MSLVDLVISKLQEHQQQKPDTKETKHHVQQQPQELDPKETKHRDVLVNVIAAALSSNLGTGPRNTRSFAITKQGALILSGYVPDQYIPHRVWHHYKELFKYKSLSDTYTLYHLVYFEYGLAVLNSGFGFMVGESLFSNLKGIANVGRFILYSFGQQFCDHSDDDTIKQCIGVIFSGINAYDLTLAINEQRVSGVGGAIDGDASTNDDSMDTDAKQSSRNKKKRKNGDETTKNNEEAPKPTEGFTDRMWNLFKRNRKISANDTFAAHKNIAAQVRASRGNVTTRTRSINDRLLAGETPESIRASMAAANGGAIVYSDDVMEDVDDGVTTAAYHSSGRPTGSAYPSASGTGLDDHNREHTYNYDQDSMVD